MSEKPEVVLCSVQQGTRDLIAKFADELRKAAPTIGSHNLTPEEFERAGIFHGAIERLRGIQAATTRDKKAFIDRVLTWMLKAGRINGFQFQGGGERHDYEIRMPNGYIVIIETKGCLDGNNTTIYERPPQADEFIIWSLCQNPTADPRSNAWSGLHTRLGAELIHRRQIIDAVVIWDMLCSSASRPCPKVLADPGRITTLGEHLHVPPPCIYLLPHSVPDPRDSPNPACRQLQDVRFAHALWEEFRGDARDVVEMRIEVRINGATTERRSHFMRDGQIITTSRWTAVKRARR